MIPLNLSANDIKTHIINVDSRFRESGSSASDFQFRLFTPVKNVLRVRITSIEFPHTYHIFTKARKNISFRILYDMSSVIVVIPEGNYSASDIPGALNVPSWLTVAYNSITGRFTFTGTRSFSLDMEYDIFDRQTEYGLGYYLGFSRNGGKPYDSSGNIVISNQMANFARDPYVLLKLNDFDCVQHTMEYDETTAMAKIVLSDSHAYTTFDDNCGKHMKEIVFQSPQNVSRFHVKLIDPYGCVLDLSAMQCSFSLEVLEIKSLGLYTAIRDSFSSVS